jgi:hypothetical protein
MVISPLMMAPSFTPSITLDSVLPCCNTDFSCELTHISHPLMEEITRLTSSKNSLPSMGLAKGGAGDDLGNFYIRCACFFGEPGKGLLQGNEFFVDGHGQGQE